MASLLAALMRGVAGRAVLLLLLLKSPRAHAQSTYETLFTNLPDGNDQWIHPPFLASYMWAGKNIARIPDVPANLFLLRAELLEFDNECFPWCDHVDIWIGWGDWCALPTPLSHCSSALERCN